MVEVTVVAPPRPGRVHLHEQVPVVARDPAGLLFFIFPCIMDKIDVSSVGPPPMLNLD